MTHGSALREFLCELLGCEPKRPPSVSFIVSVRPKKKRSRMPLIIDVDNTQEAVVKINPNKANPDGTPGKPLKIDPNVPIEWTKLDGEATFFVPGDGTTVVLKSQDDLDDTPESIFKVKFDAKEGPDVQTIEDTVTLRVSSATADNAGLSQVEIRPKT